MTSLLARCAIVLISFSTAVPAQSPQPAQVRSSAYTPLDAAARVVGLDRMVTLVARDLPLRDVVRHIANQADVSFTFDPSLAGLDRPITIDSTRTTAAAALLSVLEGTPVQAMVSSTGHVVLIARPARAPRAPLVRGQVLSAGDESPLGGARVDLVGTRFSTVTRDDGSFSLGAVPPGRYTLRTIRIGFQPFVRDSLTIDSDVPAFRLVLEPTAIPLSAMIVTPGYFGFLQPSIVTPQALSRHRIETAPQLGEDIFRVVNRLPGVTGNNFNAKLAVRGGLPEELYVSLDGLQLYEPFHLRDMGGALSILDIQTLGRAELTTGAPSVEYGDELAGVFALYTLDPATDRARTSVGASIMNLRGMSQGGIASGRGSWLVSARRGFLDLAFKLAKTGDSISPRYEDVFAKARYDLGRAGELTAHVLYAGDYLDYLDAPDPSIHSKYTSGYAWLTWNTPVGSVARGQTILSTGRLDWRRHGDGRQRGRQFAAIRDTRSHSSAGLKQDWTVEIGSRAMFKAGFDARHESATYDYFSWIERVALDSVKRTFTFNDTTRVVAAPATDRLALYIAPRIRPIESLTLETGVRLDRSTHTGDRVVSPRLNVSWEARRGTTVRAAWGHYAQTHPLFALQVEDGVDRFYPAEESEQRVLGVEQLLPRGFVARVEAYDRLLSNVRPRFTNASPSIEVFPEVINDRLHVVPTGGRSRGVELFLGRDGGDRVDWGVSYARAASTDDIRGRAVPRSLDQRHSLAIDWSVHPVSNRWRLSVAGIWHSGWPYTPSIVRVDTSMSTPQQFGVFTTWTYPELNSARAPNYRRVDARWTRFLDTKRGRVSFFIEVFNLLNTQNIRGYYTNVIVDSRRRTLALVSQTSTEIPRLPSAGISWEF